MLNNVIPIIITAVVIVFPFIAMTLTLIDSVMDKHYHDVNGRYVESRYVFNQTTFTSLLCHLKIVDVVRMDYESNDTLYKLHDTYVLVGNKSDEDLIEVCKTLDRMFHKRRLAMNCSYPISLVSVRVAGKPNIVFPYVKQKGEFS